MRLRQLRPVGNCSNIGKTPAGFGCLSPETSRQCRRASPFKAPSSLVLRPFHSGRAAPARLPCRRAVSGNRRFPRTAWRGCPKALHARRLLTPSFCWVSPTASLQRAGLVSFPPAPHQNEERPQTTRPSKTPIHGETASPPARHLLPMLCCRPIQGSVERRSCPMVEVQESRILRARR